MMVKPLTSAGGSAVTLTNAGLSYWHGDLF
jgi:hypothetical protein